MASTREWPVIALRLCGELVVIVVGVLIALSADAWLEGRQDRGAEVRHLQALQEDLVDSRTVLEESNRQRTRLFSALVRLAEEDLSATPPDTVARWVYDGLFSVESFEPQLTALVDLQNSDQLRLLTPAVRREIAELDRLVDELERVEADFLTSQQDLLDPYLVEHMPLAAILAVADSLPLSVQLPVNQDWSSLGRDEVRNALAFKLSLGKIATEFRRQIGEQIATLVDMIEERLEELGYGAR